MYWSFCREITSFLGSGVECSNHNISAKFRSGILNVNVGKTLHINTTTTATTTNSRPCT
jgi:hypothetical protein